MVLEVDEETKEALKEAFLELVEPVECLVFTSKNEECLYCEETVELCKLLEETSNGMISVKVFNKEDDPEVFNEYGVNRVPSILLLDGIIRYTGIPSGEEIRGLVETIIRISAKASGLEENTIVKIKEELKGKVYIEVIVTPTCPYCPYAALLANMFALVGEGKIISDTIEALENPDIAEEYGITAVPAIVINGNVEFIGIPHEEDLLKAIIKYQQEEIPIPWHRKHPHQLPDNPHEL